MHSNRPYEAGRAKAKQDLGLHPVQPPAPWTQEVDKRLRVRTGSAMEKDPSEKRAYGLKDVLGDALAAGTGGLQGLAEGHARAAGRAYDSAADAVEKTQRATQRAAQAKYRAADAEHEAWRTDPGSQAHFDAIAATQEAKQDSAFADQAARDAYSQHRSASNDYRNAEQNKVHAGWGALLGGSVPVNGHWLATPIATTLGRRLGLEFAGEAGAGTLGHVLGGAGGALAGRLLIRGADALGDHLAKKKEAPPDAEKKSFDNADRLPGGPADKKKPADFDRKQLLKGQQHEMEHTTDPSLAREIASDHLTEHPNYYERLLKAEKNWGK